jgi:hypothetical protein
MSNILFAGNDLSAYAGQGAVTFDTTTVLHDPKYADGEIVISAKDKAFGFFREPVILGGSCWVHFRVHWGTVVSFLRYVRNSYATTDIVGLYDQSNPSARPLGVRFNMTSGDQPVGLQAFSGTDLAGADQLVGNVHLTGQDKTFTVDVNATLDPIFGKILMYFDGVLVLSYYGDTTLSGQITEWNAFYHQSPAVQTNVTGKLWISEGLASKVSTIGQRVASLRPIADGDRAEWTGNFDNVNDLIPDDGTTLSSNTPEAVHLMQLSALDATLPLDLSVTSLVTSVRGSDNGTGAVTGIEHAVKSGGVEAFGTTHSIATVVQTDQEMWDVNPVTGLPWTKAEIDAIQVGVKAKA